MRRALRFNELCEQLEVVEHRGDLDVRVGDVTDDSRCVTPGCVFVAVKGVTVDGHGFIQDAIAAGASAIIAERPVAGTGGTPFVLVRDSHEALGLLAAASCQDPSRRLYVIGVTGTNGKTTVTYLAKAVLEAAGSKVGLLGTVAYVIGEERLPAAHTTPGAIELQQLLKRMVGRGMEAAVLEVSSHALALNRVAGCEFDVGIFTNLSQDHLDFHAGLEDYFTAKLKLFTTLHTRTAKQNPKRAIVNLDDPYGERVKQACQVPVWTYGLRVGADIQATQISLSLEGSRFVATTPAGPITVKSRLVGEYNVSNMLAAIGVGLQAGVSRERIEEALEGIQNIPGRFERVEAGQPFTVVVDYAHSEDALLRVLTTLHELKTGRILTVFGCGGDRDRDKRPKMGRVAARWSDVVFLTSDNPRSEDPMAILREVEPGVRDVMDVSPREYHLIPDRRQAIFRAIETARPDDLVVIAGKGHEQVQIVGAERIPFDDRAVARSALEQRRDAFPAYQTGAR